MKAEKGDKEKARKKTWIGVSARICIVLNKYNL